MILLQREEDVRVSPVQPTQFLIGGGSSAAMGSHHGRGGNHTGSKGGGGPSINDEMNEMIHPLQKLQPEVWNNIPICLVRAVKTLIDSGISTDQKLRQANSTVDTGLKKVLALN